MSRGDTVRYLMDQYGLKEERAKSVCDIANEFGRKADPCDGGFVHVVYRGCSRDWPFPECYDVYDHTGRDSSPAGVAPARPVDYTSPISVSTPNQRGKAMPPKGRRAAAAPVEEPEETEDEIEVNPFDRHLTKELSPTMSDYADWFHENVADINVLGKTDPGRLLALGSSLYPHFQKSELNQARREARKADRAAANGADEEEEAPAPAKPAARGRAATKAAPARAAKAASPASPAKPVRRGRGAAAASVAEPY